jgi:hypothetical protein
MLEMASLPESLSGLTQVLQTRSLSPADFQNLPYSSNLLLLAPFDASLTGDPEYEAGCECGFDSYFAEMSHWLPNLTGFFFVDRLHTSASVRDYLLRNVAYDPVRNPSPLAWSAGWGLGWLSALALTDQSLALMGLELLQHIVLHDESDC